MSQTTNQIISQNQVQIISQVSLQVKMSVKKVKEEAVHALFEAFDDSR